METQRVVIRTATIRLDALLKFAGLAATGGEAKQRVQAGEVKVNGETETRRSRELEPGDRVDWLGDPGGPVRARLIVAAEEEPGEPGSAAPGSGDPA